MPASQFSILSSNLLASVPTDVSEQDVDWSVISLVLSKLHQRTQKELKELTTALDVARTTSSTFTFKEHDDVLAIYNELQSLSPHLAVAEQHFLQLESIIRPGICKLQTLYSRTKYLDTAVQVEELSQKAKDQVKEATPDSLRAFQDFTAFVATIPVEFAVLRNEAIHRVEELSVDLHRFAVEKLQVALEKVGWPDPLTTQQELTEKIELRQVSKAFEYLLILQLSQLSHPKSVTRDLWAMDCVLEPLLLRFRYHFERAESVTNRLTKPEWYLSHVQEQTSAHTRFLAHALTPELHRHREEIHCCDAQILLLRGLVKAASRKITQDLPTLLTHPVLLCHTLDEILLFEQTIDEDIGYGSWASTDRRAYPRCIDVFTSNNDVLFAWTNADVEYAHRMLSSILGVESLTDESEYGFPHEKKDSVWQLEVDVYVGRSASEHNTELIAPVALQFVALLDFLSQRFALMETEEHRYLYVMQVHLPLLRRFGQVCDARGRRLISAVTKKIADAKTLLVWGELFVVANALQHVAHTLAAWEQSSVFLELSRKIARSETTRAQVLQMHMAYSKQLFVRASAAVLATEEATAVRQALSGPGAMIGPTAALSAAYSVGSKTMKSFFHRAETNDKVKKQYAPAFSVDSALPAVVADANENSPKYDLEEEQDDSETLLFSHTIFERQILELKSLATTLLEGGKDALMQAVECDMEAYRLSPFWITICDDDATNDSLSIMHTVSSELAGCYTLIGNVLSCARKLLLPECSSVFWKPLATALDSALFDAFYNLASTEVTHLSSKGKRQFIEDVKSLTAIFAAGSSKTLPRSYFQLTREVCHLLEMPAPRLREICKALDDQSVASTGESAVAMEQLATILEACGIFLLTPAQVVWICTTRLEDCR
ncbi:hypothetical protein KXD40_009519 [Peronospora effusa]|uniref:Uncharacterized protein n=1 Tax=Peronospora effusa TaxID=542832 RepID=A0A3M6VGB0_9STRA|nr:hypothetical protein DD238_003155 [Peronospora effusa]UIZ23854.1 hypothetical protein KXD40_009519 [Peronospora effusa]